MAKAPPKRGVTVAVVRQLALAMERTIEQPSYGTPGFRVDDQLFARVLDDDESIVVRVNPQLRSALIASTPNTFAVTAPYENQPWVIVRLGAITAGELRSVLTEAWKIAATPNDAGRWVR